MIVDYKSGLTASATSVMENVPKTLHRHQLYVGGVASGSGSVDILINGTWVTIKSVDFTAVPRLPVVFEGECDGLRFVPNSLPGVYWYDYRISKVGK